MATASVVQEKLVAAVCKAKNGLDVADRAISKMSRAIHSSVTGEQLRERESQRAEIYYAEIRAPGGSFYPTHSKIRVAGRHLLYVAVRALSRIRMADVAMNTNGPQATIEEVKNCMHLFVFLQDSLDVIEIPLDCIEGLDSWEVVENSAGAL